MAQQKKSSNPALAFSLGFLVGAMAGVATAIVLTPQAGSDTRNQLARRASQTAEVLSRQLQEVRQMASDLAGDLKEDVSEWAQRTRERLSANLQRDQRGLQPEGVSNN